MKLFARCVENYPEQVLQMDNKFYYTRITQISTQSAHTKLHNLSTHENLGHLKILPLNSFHLFN